MSATKVRLMWLMILSTIGKAVLGEDSVEIVEYHPVEDGALGMPGAIDTSHSKKS